MALRQSHSTVSILERRRSTTQESLEPEAKDFGSLLNETIGRDSGFDGSVVTGRVVRLTEEFAIVDVGLKSEGRVALKEFTQPGQKPEIKSGDIIELFVERYEDRDGSIVLSREKARREESWTLLERQFEANTRVNGTIYGRVKGGFTVDLGGAVAFLPGSQVDIRPVRDVAPLMGVPQPFQILKMDRARGNIVVSRRAVLEETRAEQRSELIQGLKEGMILDGVVKNITDYGAFVDLGGVDGLLHVTDIAWRRINHPAEALTIGQAVRVQVIRLNADTQRISLGLKQVQRHPWEQFAEEHPVGSTVEGEIRNITEFGLFVGLAPEIDGMVHLSDLSWDEAGETAVNAYEKGAMVTARVLDIDAEKERISLGVKQLQEDPFAESMSKVKKGEVVTCIVTAVQANGIEVRVDDVLTGFIRRAELSREKSDQRPDRFEVGEKVDAKITAIDRAARKLSLTIKGREVEEDKQAMAEFGTTDSGASLGDILGAAIRQREETDKKSSLAKAIPIDTATEPALGAGSGSDPRLVSATSLLALALGGAETALLHGLVEKLCSEPGAGVKTCLAVSAALTRLRFFEASHSLCRVIHGVLLDRDRDGEVSLVMLAQAQAHHADGDRVARDLYAVEAADGFAQSGDMAGLTAALELTRVG